VSPANGAVYVPELPETPQYHGVGQPDPWQRKPDQWQQGTPQPASARGRRNRSEPGLPGWAAVLLLVVIAGIGGVIDQVTGSNIRGAFSYALVAASLIAILAVKRGQMFGVVIAPPLVYFVASGAKLYLSGGLHDRKVLFDAASSWLVYGFPAIAGATAIVLVIAGIRMIARR
jgi:fumarate reductase subunit D